MQTDCEYWDGLYYTSYEYRGGLGNSYSGTSISLCSNSIKMAQSFLLEPCFAYDFAHSSRQAIHIGFKF